MISPRTATFGAVTLDQRYTPKPGSSLSKRDCTRNEWLGGGPANIAETIKNLAGNVSPTLLVGDDRLGAHVSDLAKLAFADVHCLNWLDETRQSVIRDDIVDTIRSEVRQKRLTPDVASRLRAATMTVVAPMPTGAFELVRDVLKAANRSVLQLSEAQLLDQDATFSLAALADLVIVNEGEGQLLTGRTDPREMFAVAHGRRIKRMIITAAGGATFGCRGRAPVEVPGFAARAIARTVGAGDCFVGGLVKALSEGAGMEDAIRSGHAAALLWVEGSPINPEALEEVLSSRPTASKVPAPTVSPVRSAAVQFAVAAGVLLALATGLWI